MVFKKLPVKIEDIKNILNIPFKKIDYNNNFIKSLLFKKYTSDYDKNIELLRIDIENGRDGEYKEYYKYLDKIRTHLDDYDIFKIVNEIEDDNSVAFYNELKSLLLSYDPLNINDNQLIKLKNLLFSEKCIKLYNSIIIYEFRNAIIHNNTGGKVTKNTLKNKLKERVINYYTIQFISNIINNLYFNIGYSVEGGIKTIKESVTFYGNLDPMSRDYFVYLVKPAVFDISIIKIFLALIYFNQLIN
jgi:hypothetical protein